MKKGFTLIELLVVVLIIGILAAIAVPQYQRAVEKARAVEAASMIMSLQKGIDMYLLASGYPSGSVIFVGGTNTTSPMNHQPLDIDVKGGLKCKNDPRSRCESDTFYYYAYCSKEFCSMSAEPKTTNTYYLYASKSNASAQWIRACSIQVPGSSLGIGICKNLEAEGWVLSGYLPK